MGGGVGLIDYDGDGWLDVYCRPGRARSPTAPASPDGGDRLFRNRGDGTFEDVTEPRRDRRRSAEATATASRSATSTTTATPTCSSPAGGRYALYRNRGDGTFEDATDRAGPGRRPGLADLGGLRRPRRRRRPRPLRLPLPRLGPRDSAPCPDPDRPGRARLLRPPGLRGRARPRLPQRRRPVRRRHGRGGDRRQGRPGPGRRRWPTSTTTAGSTSTSPTT